MMLHNDDRHDDDCNNYDNERYRENLHMRIQQNNGRAEASGRYSACRSMIGVSGQGSGVRGRYVHVDRSRYCCYQFSRDHTHATMQIVYKY